MPASCPAQLPYGTASKGGRLCPLTAHLSHYDTVLDLPDRTPTGLCTSTSGLEYMDDNSSPSTAHDSSFSDYVDSTTTTSRDFTAVALGEHLIRPWYSSGYPKRLVGDSTSGNCRLFVCELCFKYTVDIAKAVAHRVRTSLLPRHELIT